MLNRQYNFNNIVGMLFVYCDLETGRDGKTALKMAITVITINATI